MLAVMLKALGGRRASGELHSALLIRVFRLPVVFFDTTPIGRIVNRFGKDVDTIDINIPSNVEMFLGCLIKVIGTIIVISITTPFILIAAVPLAVLYFLIQVQWTVGGDDFGMKFGSSCASGFTQCEGAQFVQFVDGAYLVKVFYLLLSHEKG